MAYGSQEPRRAMLVLVALWPALLLIANVGQFGPPLGQPSHFAPSSENSLSAFAHRVTRGAGAFGPTQPNRQDSTEPPSPDGVAYTLVAANDSVISGPFNPPVPGQLSGAIFDPQNGLIYVGDSQGSYVYGVNGSTGEVAESVRTGWTPLELAWDQASGSILVGTGGGLLEVSPSSGTMRVVTHGNIGPAAEGSMGLAYDPENGYAYAVDFTDNLVSVINVTSGAYVTNISVGGGPQTLAYDSLDQLVYVGSSWGSSVSVISANNNTVVAGPIGLGGTPPNSYPYPNCMVYDPLNGLIYVGSDTSQWTNTSVLNASTHSLVASNLSTGGSLSMVYDPANGHVYAGGFAGRIADMNGTRLGGTGIYDPNLPAGLAFDARDNLVYAANSGDNTLTSFNATTGALAQPHLALSDTFLRATFDPLSGNTYVATPDPGFLCLTPGTLTVVNGSSPRLVSSIPVGFGPEASVVATRSGYLFVANACSNNVTLIDPGTSRVLVAGVPVGVYPVALAYDSIHDQVVVANAFSQNLTILNGSTGAVVVANVSVGSYPSAVAFDSRSGWLYVANLGSDSVSVLNSSTDLPARPDIPVGSAPESLLYDATDNTVIVANSGSGNLTVINGTTGRILDPSVPAGVGPVAVALDPGPDLLYVADAAGGTVTVVSLATDSAWGSPIQVNSDPQGIVYAPATNLVEVSDFKAGTISVLAVIPKIGSFDVVPATVEVGQSTEVVANASEAGGGPLTYSYSGLPGGCLPENASVLLCTPVAAGEFSIGLTVTDPAGYEGHASAALAVAPVLSPATLKALPSVLDLGEALTLSTQVTVGVGPLAYIYSGLPPGCSGANASSFTCAPTSVGAYTMTVTVVDSTGARSFSAATATVVAPPSVVAFWATPEASELGSPLTLVAVAGGGVYPLSYSYSGLPPGCVGANRTTISCTPTAAGAFSPVVVVVDAHGRWSNATTNLLVEPATIPAAPTILGFWASPASLTLRNETTLYALVEGGAQPVSYAYSELPPGCSTASTAALTCQPTTTGTYEVRVTATDALQRNVSATTALLIESAPAGSGPSGGDAYGGLPTGVLIGLALGGGAVAGAAAGFAAVWIGSPRAAIRRTDREEPPRSS